MSAELTALEDLASNFRAAWFLLSPTSQAVLFYATPYLEARFNWINRNIPTDEVTDADWDTIQAYVDGLLYEAKNPMIGIITPYVTSDPPTNVLPCDCATYLRVDFPILYDVLDTFFIVDADHFKVPDLRGRTVIGAGDGSGLSSRSVGDSFGEESHTLDISEMPNHDHTIPYTIRTLVLEPGEVTALTPVPLLTQCTGTTGGDGSHNNMQPSYALNYGIIAS